MASQKITGLPDNQTLFDLKPNSKTVDISRFNHTISNWYENSLPEMKRGNLIGKNMTWLFNYSNVGAIKYQRIFPVEPIDTSRLSPAFSLNLN